MKEEERERKRRIARPEGFMTFIDMQRAAEEAGWGSSVANGFSSSYVHETPSNSIKPLSHEENFRILRMVHFSSVVCGGFAVHTPVFCVVLLSSGKIKVYRHLVGECKYSRYPRITTPASVRQVIALRRGTKIREENKS